jgi:L-threonylcarbamoyladenylate synthase
MIGDDIEIAIKLLNMGMLVGIPTETVYGLAGNALDEKAVSEIFAVKQRPDFNPLILHLAKIENIEDYVTEFPDALQKLVNVFMPGPLSVLLPKKSIVPDIVTAGSNRVAIRVPSHPLTSSLLAQLDFPLAAPSANPFGYISPTTAFHVNQQLGEKIPYILDGGPCGIGIESTIVGEEDGQIIVYRKGGIAISAIEAIVGKVMVKEHSASNPAAPGMLSSHYAPTKPIKIGLLPDLIATYSDKNFATISFNTFIENIDSDRQYILSMTKDYREAARNLFSTLRTIDEKDFEIILVELLPEEDLGIAINDRLKRASA